MALTDVEIGRALNALSATLDDQKARRADPARLQEIVTCSLGGERLIDVHEEPGSAGSAAWLQDRATGERVGEVRLTGDRWATTRTRDARNTRAYVPAKG